MAKSVLTHLDFKSVAQLKNALLDIRSTMPTGVAGQVAYNSTTNKFGYHNGTEWVYPGDYSLPTASSTVLGGVKVGSTLAISSGVLNQKSGIATAGTYRSVTVDTYGRVTSGTNPTTLSGYGITDAKIQNGVITLGSATITPMTNLAVGGTGHTDELAITKGGATSYLTVPFATKATKDGSNNVIADTYATKTQLGNAVPDNMTTAGHLLLSTAEGGKSAWSAWTTKGILQTSNTGVVSVKTPTLWGVTFTGDNVSTAPNLYIGTTKVQTSSAAQHVTGVASLTIGDAVLSWDSTNKALKLAKRDGTSSDIGFWAEGFVSAFGPSSTEGGGTDITAEDIISILNAYTPGEKIKAEVLNVAGGGGLAWTDLENATSTSHVIDNSHLPSSITGLVSKVAALESSAVTGATITGSGNAVTSVSKSGNTITFTKGLSFPVLDNGKIPMSYLPDAILGQVIYGGTLGANALATLTANAKAKLGTTASTLTLSTGSTGTGGYTKNEGIYYIASTSQTFGSISLQVGDWLLSTGSGWTKIDNTDAVTGVKGNAESSYRIGNINITPANIGKATTSALGCVQIGSGLSVDANGIVSITASNIVSALGNTAVNRATADASGNTITSTYVSGVSINGDRLRVTKNGGNTDLTIPYALASNMVRNSGEIATETSIAQDGLRHYAGNGVGWTGAESTMAYSAILAIGSPNRGFQIWAQRGDGIAGSLNFHVGNSGATAWNGRRVILDSENYSSYFGYIGKTKVQASSALQTLTGIQLLEVQPTASGGAPVIDFQGGGNNFINVPSAGSLVFSVGGASYTKEHFRINSDGLTLSKSIFSGSGLMYQWRGSSTVNSAGYNAYFAYASGDIYIATYGNSNSGKTVLLETYDTDILHRKNGTNHKIWDASNSNLSTVDWAAKNLSVAGNVTIGNSITTPRIYIKGSANSDGFVNADSATNMYVSVGGKTVLVIDGSANHVRRGASNTGATLGTSAYPWGGVYTTGLSATGNATVGGTLSVAGATTFNNTLTARSLTYAHDYQANISSAGWYRCYVAKYGVGIGDSLVLHIERNFANHSNESYTFSINAVYSGGVSITQISGHANYQKITKIRVDYTNGGGLYVDFYCAGLANETYYVYGSGAGTFQAPTLVSAPTGTTKEFDVMADGIHSSGGILSDSYIRATGNITGYYSSSDLRLKKNFTDLNLELDAVANLPLKSYDRTDCGDKRTDGTIAQEVQKLLPNEVYDRGDGYLAMAEGQLGLIFGINAHKEIMRLRKRIEELERRLN